MRTPSEAFCDAKADPNAHACDAEEGDKSKANP
jgi:hypothetical protein